MSTQVEEGTLRSADGTELFWRGYVPADARAVVVVAHGLGEHSGRYQNVVDELVPRRFAVYALDHRGHGRSDGPRAYVQHLSLVVDDFEMFRAHVCARHPGAPRFVLGHSFGGLVVLAHATEHPNSAEGIVLSGPASASAGRTSFATVARYRVLGWVAPRRGVLYIDPALVSRDANVVEAYRADPLVHHGAVPARTVAEMRARARRLPREVSRVETPMLLMHGGADQVVPPDATRLLATRVGSRDLEVRIFDDMYHEIFNDPERAAVLGCAATWLDQRCATNNRA
jgi:alpha-beta hydrolase superfamily lysophospholipase